MRALVLDVAAVGGVTFVVLQLTAGDVELGLVVTSSAGSWRVTGISTIDADSWRAGKRAVSLSTLTGVGLPASGEQLIALRQTRVGVCLGAGPGERIALSSAASVLDVSEIFDGLVAPDGRVRVG